MNAQLIESNYDMKVSNMRLLDEHFGTEIYLINADTPKYIVKVMPLHFENIENEGLLTEFLYHCGHKVAQLLKSRGGKYVIKTPEFQFTVQEYIEGKTLPINSAPKWFLNKSADFLGKTTLALKDYAPLPLRFGRDFLPLIRRSKRSSSISTNLKRRKSPEIRILFPFGKNRSGILNESQNSRLIPTD